MFRGLMTSRNKSLLPINFLYSFFGINIPGRDSERKETMPLRVQRSKNQEVLNITLLLDCEKLNKTLAQNLTLSAVLTIETFKDSPVK